MHETPPPPSCLGDHKNDIFFLNMNINPFIGDFIYSASNICSAFLAFSDFLFFQLFGAKNSVTSAVRHFSGYKIADNGVSIHI